MDEKKKRVLRGFRYLFIFECCLFAAAAFVMACIALAVYCEPMPMFLWLSGLTIAYYLWAEELKRDENKT